jgi:MFS family permease
MLAHRLAGCADVAGRRLFGWARRTPYLADLPRDVAVLSFVAFSVALGYGIAAPVIPVYARTFGVSAFLATLVISGFAFMRLVSAAPAGLMVDRFGERRVMSVGIWIVALSSLATALAQDFTQLLVLRGLGGIGSSMFTVSAMALVLRTAGPEERGRASGAFQAGFLFGGVLGPAVGGLVTGISIRAPFLVYGLTLVGAGVIAARQLSQSAAADLPGTPDGPREATGPREAAAPPWPGPAADSTGAASLGAALRSSAYRAALMVNLSVGFIVFGLRISLVPLYATEELDLVVGLVGLTFVLATGVQAVALVPAGRRTDTVGRRASLLVGTGSMALSMLLLVLGTGSAGLFLAMAASGLAMAFMGAPASAVVGDVTRGRSGGRVVSAYQMVGDLGGILGPLLAGALVDALGFSWAFGTGLGVAVVALVMVTAMPETLRRSSNG